jgi:hypothetical protein
LSRRVLRTDRRCAEIGLGLAHVGKPAGRADPQAITPDKRPPGEWAAIRRFFRRARWRYQACGRWGALEVHHVVKRAQGGSDFDLDRLVALCPRATPRRMPPTRAAGCSSPPWAPGALSARSSEGPISGRSACSARSAPGNERLPRDGWGRGKSHAVEAPGITCQGSIRLRDEGLVE